MCWVSDRLAARDGTTQVLDQLKLDRDNRDNRNKTPTKSNWTGWRKFAWSGWSSEDGGKKYSENQTVKETRKRGGYKYDEVRNKVYVAFLPPLEWNLRKVADVGDTEGAIRRNSVNETKRADQKKREEKKALDLAKSKRQEAVNAGAIFPPDWEKINRLRAEAIELEQKAKMPLGEAPDPKSAAEFIYATARGHQPAVPTPAVLAPAPAPARFCPSCGTASVAGARFCRSCGGTL